MNTPTPTGAAAAIPDDDPVNVPGSYEAQRAGCTCNPHDATTTDKCPTHGAKSSSSARGFGASKSSVTAGAASFASAKAAADDNAA